MKLTLAYQKSISSQITPKVVQLKGEMNKRKDVWLKLSIADRKNWLNTGKDPIMSLAKEAYDYLDNFFKGMNDV